MDYSTAVRDLGGKVFGANARADLCTSMKIQKR